MVTAKTLTVVAASLIFSGCYSTSDLKKERYIGTLEGTHQCGQIAQQAQGYQQVLKLYHERLTALKQLNPDGSLIPQSAAKKK